MDLVCYRDKKDIPGFIIGLAALALVYFRPVELLIEQLKNPVVFNGVCGHGLWSNSLKLRADNTFEYKTSGFLTRETLNGSYLLYNDTLVLNYEVESLDLPKKLVKIDGGFIEKDSTKIHRHHFGSNVQF